MKKSIFIFTVLIFLVTVVWAGYFFWRKFSNINTAVKPPQKNIVQLYEQLRHKASSTVATSTKPDEIASTTPTSTLSNLIVVDSPKVNDMVASPILISGRARGNWFFEASFPVKLLDADRNVIVQAPAQARGEWMTEDFVPFSLSLAFTVPTSSASGYLVLENDNPSGLPANSKSLELPVRFR
ncbi:hypothetical protein HGA64_01650 [Candidatus Falkowbacteria bacterium]|nr:hypothetical protein [Candidatus Falkowbacteria bacterium]